MGKVQESPESRIELDVHHILDQIAIDKRNLSSLVLTFKLLNRNHDEDRADSDY